MDAPTIAQIKAIPNDSLWQFLMQLPMTMEAQIFYALLIGNLIGMAGHYFKQWGTGEIAGNMWAYLVVEYPRKSMLSLFGIITLSATEVATGLFVTAEGMFVGWALVLLSGIKTGYAGDSLLNEGDRAVWSDTKRKATAILGKPKTQENQ
jgi:hypothetical protein